MSGNPLPSGWGGWLGWAAAVAVGLGTIIVNWRKGKAEATSLIMERWQELYDRHAQDIKDVRDELRKERETSATLRRSLEDAHGKINDLSQRMAQMERRHNEEMIAKDQHIAGLQRQLSQTAKSGLRLGGAGLPEDSETMKAIDRAERRALKRKRQE